MKSCPECSCGGAEKCVKKNMPDEKTVCSNLHRNVSLGRKKSLSFSLMFILVYPQGFSPFSHLSNSVYPSLFLTNFVWPSPSTLPLLQGNPNGSTLP